MGYAAQAKWIENDRFLYATCRLTKDISLTSECVNKLCKEIYVKIRYLFYTVGLKSNVMRLLMEVCDDYRLCTGEYPRAVSRSTN